VTDWEKGATWLCGNNGHGYEVVLWQIFVESLKIRHANFVPIRMTFIN